MLWSSLLLRYHMSSQWGSLDSDQGWNIIFLSLYSLHNIRKGLPFLAEDCPPVSYQTYNCRNHSLDLSSLCHLQLFLTGLFWRELWLPGIYFGNSSLRPGQCSQLYITWNSDQSTSGSALNTFFKSPRLRFCRLFSWNHPNITWGPRGGSWPTLVLRRKYPVSGIISPILTIWCFSASFSAASVPPGKKWRGEGEMLELNCHLVHAQRNLVLQEPLWGRRSRKCKYLTAFWWFSAVRGVVGPPPCSVLHYELFIFTPHFIWYSESVMAGRRGRREQNWDKTGSWPNVYCWVVTVVTLSALLTQLMRGTQPAGHISWLARVWLDLTAQLSWERDWGPGAASVLRDTNNPLRPVMTRSLSHYLTISHQALSSHHFNNLKNILKFSLWWCKPLNTELVSR